MNNCCQSISPSFLRPHYDIRVSIGSTLLTLQPLKIIVYAPSGASVPEGASFDVRKVIGSSPISSTKKQNPSAWMGFVFLVWDSRYRTRKGRPCLGKAKKCPGDTFLARGRVLWLWGRSPQDCGHRAIPSTKPDRKVGLFLFSRSFQGVGATLGRPPKNVVFRIFRRKIIRFFALRRWILLRQNPRAIKDRPYGNNRMLSHKNKTSPGKCKIRSPSDCG